MWVSRSKGDASKSATLAATGETPYKRSLRHFLPHLLSFSPNSFRIRPNFSMFAP